MTKPALVKALSGWVKTVLAPGGGHCFDVRPRYRIPGVGPVDLLALRHTGSAPTDHFSIGLWSILEGRIDDKAVDAMTRRVLAFEAWYSELLEHAEIQGFSPAHRISVSGNLVGRTIRCSPLIDLLSNWGSAVYFWKWKRAASGFDVSPCTGRDRNRASARSQLKGLLHHLPWQDTAERDLEAAAKPAQRR